METGGRAAVSYPMRGSGCSRAGRGGQCPPSRQIFRDVLIPHALLGAVDPILSAGGLCFFVKEVGVPVGVKVQEETAGPQHTRPLVVCRVEAQLIAFQRPGKRPAGLFLS